MKKAIPLLLSLLLLSVPLCSTCVQSESFVYICTGKSAYSYHSKRNCSGLNNCRASIKKVTLNYAKSLNRTPCRKCYKL